MATSDEVRLGSGFHWLSTEKSSHVAALSFQFSKGLPRRIFDRGMKKTEIATETLSFTNVE